MVPIFYRVVSSELTILSLARKIYSLDSENLKYSNYSFDKFAMLNVKKQQFILKIKAEAFSEKYIPFISANITTMVVKIFETLGKISEILKPQVIFFL